MNDTRTTPQVNIRQMAVAPKAVKENPLRLLPLLFWFAVAAGLYASWAFIVPVRLWWNNIDNSIFFTLNSIVASPRGPNMFWVIFSSRLFDIVPGVMLISICWSYMKNDGGLFFRRRSAEVGMMVCYVLLTVLVGKFVFDFTRASPSLVLAPNYRLSSMVPWALVKDAAPASFPSDHALLYIIIGGLLWHFTGKARALIVFFIGAVMMMPRIASGAHWFTDIAVGAVSLGTLAVALACFTPLGAVLVKLGEKILSLPPCNQIVARFESEKTE